MLGQKLVVHPREASRVLALPRGGVPVGLEVALILRAPLEVFVVRKLGMPGNPELAMGAIASGGVCLLNLPLIKQLGIPPDLLEEVIEKESALLRSRETTYGMPSRTADQKPVILVDDGAATGATMRVAVRALRKGGTRHITVALPTASRDAAALLRSDADEVVALIESDSFQSVGQWYARFGQVSDHEVIECLKQAASALGSPSCPP